MKMLNNKRYRFLPTLLAALHFIIAIFSYSLKIEGSWGFYYFMLPDFPVMLLLFLVSPMLSSFMGPNAYDATWIILISVGTVWWYFAGYLIYRFILRSRP